jgi:hypothetical protein
MLYWRTRGQSIGRLQPLVLTAFLLVATNGARCASAHPFDPLSAAEIRTAVVVLQSAGFADSATRLTSMSRSSEMCSPGSRGNHSFVGPLSSLGEIAQYMRPWLTSALSASSVGRRSRVSRAPSLTRR